MRCRLRFTDIAGTSAKHNIIKHSPWITLRPCEYIGYGRPRAGAMFSGHWSFIPPLCQSPSAPSPQRRPFLWTKRSRTTYPRNSFVSFWLPPVLSRLIQEGASESSISRKPSRPLRVLWLPHPAVMPDANAVPTRSRPFSFYKDHSNLFASVWASCGTSWRVTRTDTHSLVSRYRRWLFCRSN